MEQNQRLRPITELQLTIDDFPDFYHALLALRLPLDVEHLLELRFLINHAADGFNRPTPSSSQERQFERALRAAIESFGIENRHHCDRLVRILMMIRDLHTAHLVGSRVTELKLRDALAELRRARARAVRHGLHSLVAAIFAGIAWLADTEPLWAIKVLMLVLAYMSWESFHALPALDRQPQALRPELAEVMRRRVEIVNWKRLIHKLALILGYKQIPGMIVFRGNESRAGGGAFGLPH